MLLHSRKRVDDLDLKLGINLPSREWDCSAVSKPYLDLTNTRHSQMFQNFRNISREHIMMDATALYPNSFHPIAKLFLPDYSTLASPSSRSTTIVKYYFVNYSKAVILSPKETRLVQDTVDVDFKDRPPELDKSQPYDPFKLDIFLLGSVLHNEFHKVSSAPPPPNWYLGLTYLIPVPHRSTQTSILYSLSQTQWWLVNRILALIPRKLSEYGFRFSRIWVLWNGCGCYETEMRWWLRKSFMIPRHWYILACNSRRKYWVGCDSHRIELRFIGYDIGHEKKPECVTKGNTACEETLSFHIKRYLRGRDWNYFNILDMCAFYSLSRIRIAGAYAFPHMCNSPEANLLVAGKPLERQPGARYQV